MNTNRAGFDRQLRDLQNELLELGSMVQKSIDRSVRALAERDAVLAQQVIDEDDLLDERRDAIEEQAVQLIATQQPMARDLRTIIAAMHIATDLERMGDHAEGIAKLALRMLDEPPLKPLIDIPRMAEIVGAMVQQVLTAYVDQDATAARAVWDRDDEVDALRDQVNRELLVFMLQDPRTITRATYLIWVAHGLERMADHVTNIAEHVIYLTTGRPMPRAEGHSQPGPATQQT